MIITLDEALAINPDLTQDDLDALEQTVRQLTANKFQNLNVRYYSFTVSSQSVLTFNSDLAGLRVGDTIEISESDYNDGLYVISAIDTRTITLDGANLFNGTYAGAFITKIQYPADIAAGIRKMLKYDVAMKDKTGIKSETISRMSMTYYDVNASDNAEGYPASYLSFLKKYQKIRWG
jgi:hypothetical protein